MRNPGRESTFRFKQFNVRNSASSMKVGTDGVLLGAWAFGDGNNIEPKRILDIGSGTGLLSMMMAQRFPEAEITGIEIDPQAVEESRHNISECPWSDRITIIHSDFLSWDAREANLPYDLIISNPPFFTGGLKAPDKSRALARHTDTLPFDKLIARAASMLSAEGRMAMIIPSESVADIEFQATLNKLILTEKCLVSTVPSKPPRRTLLEFCSPASSTLNPTRCMHLSIMNSAGAYNPEYLSIVAPFYLDKT